MAGSYNHVVGPRGKLLNSLNMSQMLENGGDVHEAIEEMYGMIWWLAKGDADLVEQARQQYLAGIELSPGKQQERKYVD